MKWGVINEEFKGFGLKRLTRHEIDPKVSNGHEFQGVGGLKEVLGTARLEELPADYYLVSDDEEGNPAVQKVISSTASWYDARENNPDRAAEWRLYYPADAGKIQNQCRQGDLMIIGLRRNMRLAVLLVEAGTGAETSVLNLLGFKDLESRGAGKTRIIDSPAGDIGISAFETIEQLALSMKSLESGDIPSPFPCNEPGFSGDRAAEVITAEMLRRWPKKLGTCQEVTDLVVSKCNIEVGEIGEEPDEMLMRWLESAEGSYRAWERASLSGFLTPLRHNETISDIALAETISKKWMSLRQGRVSRAGKMMELFLCRIFNSCGLTYEWNPKIEGGKLPDFLFPGAQQYGDVSFSENKLRILGSKTTFKERWRQILAEADRVSTKHGVTRDISITPNTFEQMKTESFVVVMPSKIKNSYSNQPANLISLKDFIEEIKSL